MNVVGQGLQGQGEGQQEEGGGAEEVAVPVLVPSAGVSVAWCSQPNSPKDFAMVDQVGHCAGSCKSCVCRLCGVSTA